MMHALRILCAVWCFGNAIGELQALHGGRRPYANTGIPGFRALVYANAGFLLLSSLLVLTPETAPCP
jgi:hypothetical protein